MNNASTRYYYNIEYIKLFLCLQKTVILYQCILFQIQLFDTQIDLRKIYLNACSSFDINISLLVNVSNFHYCFQSIS